MVPAAPTGTMSCLDKQGIARQRRSRGAAINSLIAAKIQLRTCQELEERNPTAAVAVALNSTQSARIE